MNRRPTIGHSRYKDLKGQTHGWRMGPVWCWMQVVGPQAARGESYVQLHGMGFYMHESDKGPATGGIARDLVPKQEAKKNALVALVTDVEQWGGPEVSQTRWKFAGLWQRRTRRGLRSPARGHTRFVRTHDPGGCQTRGASLGPTSRWPSTHCCGCQGLVSAQHTTLTILS